MTFLPAHRTTLAAAISLVAALATTTPAAAGEYTINACGADRTNYSTQAFEDFATRGMIHAFDQLDHETTVVVNRAHPRLTPELRAIEECLARRDARPPVTIPDDRRLATMLHTGTYSLEALDRNTRLAVKRLGLAAAERLV